VAGRGKSFDDQSASEDQLGKGWGQPPAGPAEQRRTADDLPLFCLGRLWRHGGPTSRIARGSGRDQTGESVAAKIEPGGLRPALALEKGGRLKRPRAPCLLPVMASFPSLIPAALGPCSMGSPCAEIQRRQAARRRIDRGLWTTHDLAMIGQQAPPFSCIKRPQGCVPSCNFASTPHLSCQTPSLQPSTSSILVEWSLLALSGLLPFSWAIKAKEKHARPKLDNARTDQRQVRPSGQLRVGVWCWR